MNRLKLITTRKWTYRIIISKGDCAIIYFAIRQTLTENFKGYRQSHEISLLHKQKFDKQFRFRFNLTVYISHENFICKFPGTLLNVEYVNTSSEYVSNLSRRVHALLIRARYQPEYRGGIKTREIAKTSTLAIIRRKQVYETSR